MILSVLKIYLLVIFCLIVSQNFSQQIDTNLIFKGQLISKVNKMPVPNLTVYNKRLGIGTTTDIVGNFSIYFNIGDTIVCRGMLYEKEVFIIPTSYVNQRLSIELKKKNIFLKKKVVYPWPSKEQFESEFLNLKLETPVLDSVKSHLSSKNT